MDEEAGLQTLTISRPGELPSPLRSAAPSAALGVGRGPSAAPGRAPSPAAGVGEMTVDEALEPRPVALDRLGGDAIAALRQAREREPKNTKLAMLGRGAQGEVFVARDRDLKRIVAVKRIDAKADLSPEDIDQFYAEAQITAQLDHPSIVPVYDIDLDRDNRLTYSMKLVRGITLGEYIAETRRQVLAGDVDEDHGLADRLEIFLAVCAAVAYAHSRGVIHRDLKPDNIMLGPFHEVLVMDWGIAKLVGGDGPGEAVGGGEAYIVGTPVYMAPEQARGENHRLGPATDQASLGLILFELACLQKAYTGKDVMEIVVAAAAAKKRSTDIALEKVPRELRAVIDKATALEPQDRYASVQELANDVRRFVQNEEVHAAPDRLHHRVARWMSRNRAAASAIVMGLLLAALAIGAGVYVSGQRALEAQRVAAHEREQRLAGWVGAATARAGAINAAIDHWQAQLTGMAYAAQLALTREPPPGQPIYDCTDQGTAPGDLAASKVFFKPISASSLCVETAPGVDKAALTERRRQVMTLSPVFRRGRLVSGDLAVEELSRAEQDAKLRDEHLPILFTYMGMPEGLMVTYPGRDTERDDYDPRKRPWYEQAQQARGPLWMAIDSKSRRKGVVLTGAMGVRHPSTDALIGVVAIDVEFTILIDSLLTPPEGMPSDVETFLLDPRGKVVVQSSMRAMADKVRDLERQPFPFPTVAERFAAETSGSASAGPAGDEMLVVWSRVDATDWTFVVVGKWAALMGPGR